MIDNIEISGLQTKTVVQRGITRKDERALR